MSPIEDDRIDIAQLRPLTKDKGRSLADRACLPLARQLKLPVKTADRQRGDLDVGVTIELIRSDKPTMPEARGSATLSGQSPTQLRGRI